MKNEKPAKGTKGFVFADFNGNPIFRVYNYDKKDEHGSPEFVDYEIGYCDIKVEIIDDGAVFAEGRQGQPILTLSSYDPNKKPEGDSK